MRLAVEQIPVMRVLLVEDNPDDAELIQDMLSQIESLDIHYQLADRLSVAFERLDAESVDVVLLDLALPDSQHLTGLIATHAREPELPIIVLTGFNDEELGMKAVQQGAQDYLVKGQVNPILLGRSLNYAIERMRSRQQLEQCNRELKALYNKVSEMEQLKTDMIRLASHDLLGLIGIVKGYLDVLYPEIEPVLSEQQHEYFERIIGATERLHRVTRDVLSLERIETDGLESHTKMDLRDVAQTAFQQNQPQAEQKSQQYVLNIADAPLLVQADGTLLQEAIMNLISNAIKYTPEQGTVNVRVNQEDSKAIFEVQDTGYGIPQHLQTRLFQAFYRARTRQTEQIYGNGLGLYLVKQVIDRHHGQIRFHSVPGEGSLFGFQLPLQN